MIKNHIHINQYEFVTTSRVPVISLEVEMSESVNGTRHSSAITRDDDEPAVHTDYTYTVKTDLTGLENLISLAGKTVAFLDHDHLDEGDNGGPTTPSDYFFYRIEKIQNIDLILSYFLVSIILVGP